MSDREQLLETYLNKSGDTKEEFFANPGHYDNLDESIHWVEYEVIGDVFWINSLMKDFKNKEETSDVWDAVKTLARKNGCKKIQFSTQRNGLIWERLFKDMKVVQWKIETIL